MNKYREALEELVAASVPMPAAEHGMQAQTDWAARLNSAWNRARSVLSEEDESERDAMRYRWLKMYSNLTSSWAEWDAAIDAAIEAQKDRA